MTEEKPTWQTIAIEIIEALKEDAKPHHRGELDDAKLYYHFLSIPSKHLSEIAPVVSSLSENTYASVLGIILERLGGDGIVTQGEPPMWLQVTPNIPNMLPRREKGEGRWIRLSAIQEVIPQPGITSGDSRDWQYGVNVLANGEKYDVTATLFKGSAVTHPVNKLLNLVNRAVSEEHRRRAQL